MSRTPKPVVFVLPTFLAVGGVERNTVEVIAQLHDTFDFVVVTFERLASAHGSLHRQFFEHCQAVYDLAEIGTHDEILGYLRQLHEEYRPELVWICNGSPWMAANTSSIRRIFEDAAIVDQQVYDTKHGWVSLYRSHDRGLLSYDRHIAINSKIRDLFVAEAGIAPDRVDLIYPVISSERREQALASSPAALREKFGLDPARRYFASIGRLTSQKAPLDFVRLIDHAVSQGPADLDFLMIGSGELGPEVDAMIAAKGLAHRLRRIDYVQNCFELARVIDAIVFTSHYEGLPIALLEALSVGTPGLCTDVGDIGVVFERHGNGMTFDGIGNMANYQRGFADFVSHYDRYKSAADAQAQEVAREFSMETIQQKYRQCFATAMKA